MGKMYFNIKELFTMIVYLKYQLIETVNENKNKKLFIFNANTGSYEYIVIIQYQEIQKNTITQIN